MQVVKLPQQVLGPEWLERLREIQPQAWYPVGTLLELLHPYEALHTVRAEVLIVQTSCRQEGAPHCELEIHSPVRDQRWSGTHPLKS